MKIYVLHPLHHILFLELVHMVKVHWWKNQVGDNLFIMIIV